MKSRDISPKQRARARKTVDRLQLLDDKFFRKVAEDKCVCEEILRVLLEDENLRVIESSVQKTITNLQGRSVILDAHCIVSSGREIDVEVQKASNGINHFKRVRFNAACMTANSRDVNDKYTNVPDVCVIYITGFDLFKGGRAAYRVGMYVEGTWQKIDNGYQEIYVNTKCKDGTLIADLMELFTLTEINDLYFPELTRRVNYFKHDERGFEEMCSAILESCNEAAIDKCIEIIKGMLDIGIPMDKCLIAAKVPQEEWEAYRAVIDGREPVESLYTEFLDDFDEEDESSSSRVDECERKLDEEYRKFEEDMRS